MKLAVNTAKLLRNVPLPDEIATVHDAAVVVDLGSGMLKAGFSGDDAPRYVVPTVEGKPQKTEGKPGKSELKETYVCSEAYKLREKLDLAYPINKGLVTDWGDPLSMKDRTEGPIERIITHVYDDLLKVNMQDQNQPLLLSEPVLTDLSPAKENRERMCEVLFESLGIPALYIAQSPVLSLYSSGRTTGMVIEMGYGTCHTAPIFEGFPLFHSILQLNFGGADLTKMVVNMLTEQGTKFAKCHEKFIGDFVKETLCEVAADRESYELSVGSKDDEATHVLPDGVRVKLDSRRWSIAESLFRPSLLLGDADTQKGIHQLAIDSVRKCDPDIASSLHHNVVLSGGTSLIRGMPERIETALLDLIPNEKVKVYASTERSQATWIGGSILASLPTFQDLWVTRADYDEYGQSHPVGEMASTTSEYGGSHGDARIAKMAEEIGTLVGYMEAAIADTEDGSVLGSFVQGNENWETLLGQVRVVMQGKLNQRKRQQQPLPPAPPSQRTYVETFYSSSRNSKKKHLSHQEENPEHDGYISKHLSQHSQPCQEPQEEEGDAYNSYGQQHQQQPKREEEEEEEYYSNAPQHRGLQGEGVGVASDEYGHLLERRQQERYQEEEEEDYDELGSTPHPHLSQHRGHRPYREEEEQEEVGRDITAQNQRLTYQVPQVEEEHAAYYGHLLQQQQQQQQQPYRETDEEEEEYDEQSSTPHQHLSQHHEFASYPEEGYEEYDGDAKHQNDEGDGPAGRLAYDEDGDVVLCTGGHVLKVTKVGKGPGCSGYASHRCNLCNSTGLTVHILRCDICDFDRCIQCPCYDAEEEEEEQAFPAPAPAPKPPNYILSHPIYDDL